ncbi:methyltransferase type 11 [Nostoc linckia z18]|uniref:Methyltransferase type 11 n=2 Tax=Nostoc linckia TaxID=92942 RepID=A0A9Q6ENK8_NOSLI|nr:methyltransferase domain-containing protein [Nostoc linckia]PHK40356.1 methyltransferase type 11 [Nostoc linckia z15]PHK48209.1 methyltransferase type 11 [Nostoc linckia z16]PHJ68356.1 methyltransferase type 11 [Nostoc linckia z1]PHJ73792.1 methyltransferase type 11 [Nostoc linckia z3]PHJ78361.1 methyltransferase type 11 [Nostoc linckia z2]
MTDVDSYKQQLKEFYGSRTTYDREEGTRHPLDAKILLEFVPLHSGQKILDVATGTGLVAIPAAKKVGSEGYVIGIDMTPGMLHQARQKITAKKLQNIELIEADAEDFNFSDSSFDVVFCCEAIVLFPDILAALQKWYRFLKIGGFVAFTCPPETAYMASLQQRICAKVLGVSLPHILEPLGTTEKCRKLLTQAGFKDIEIKIEPSGRYRPVTDNRLSQTINNINFKGHPLLSKLSPEQLNQLQVEYKAEIEKLATAQGIWEDTTKFFVRAQK